MVVLAIEFASTHWMWIAARHTSSARFSFNRTRTTHFLRHYFSFLCSYYCLWMDRHRYYNIIADRRNNPARSAAANCTRGHPVPGTNRIEKCSYSASSLLTVLTAWAFLPQVRHAFAAFIWATLSFVLSRTRRVSSDGRGHCRQSSDPQLSRNYNTCHQRTDSDRWVGRPAFGAPSPRGHSVCTGNRDRLRINLKSIQTYIWIPYNEFVSNGFGLIAPFNQNQRISPPFWISVLIGLHHLRILNLYALSN